MYFYKIKKGNCVGFVIKLIFLLKTLWKFNNQMSRLLEVEFYET